MWAWVPKQYKEKKYENSAFPVLTALPGASGYPTNHWFGADFKLQERIAQQVEAGKSLPFIVMMPVLNAKLDQYWDGSDIPGQPKMGTWMSDDVPDLAKNGPKVHISFLLGDKEEGAKAKAFKEKIGKRPVETDLRIVPNAGHDGYKYADGLFQGPLERISKRMIGPVPGA